MVNTLPRLSVWEIGHRMQSLNPDQTDPANLPMPVKDILQSLTRAFHFDDITVFNYKGLENKKLHHVKTGHIYETEEAHEKLAECYQGKVFDRQFLESVFIENEDLGKWCLDKGIPLPDFWFLADWKPYSFEKDAPSEKLGTAALNSAPSRSDQIDKQLCQAVAKTLWDIYPMMTIADMCKHDAIQLNGNGKLYRGAHTLRDWLSEIAPDTVKGKRGRPKKSDTQ